LNKGIHFIFFLISGHIASSQGLDFNTTYKSAIEMYNKGNYNGAKVRFAIAERKADKENNYSGRQQCLDYLDRSDECVQLIKDGERTFSLGEFEIAKKYFDRIAELNPKDPKNLERAIKCRNEADYLSTKKQADIFFMNKDWNQAYTLYMVCLDSSKMELNSYKRYYNEVQLRNQECLKQMNIFNTDSIKVKLKNMKNKLFKKDKNKKDDKSTPENDKHGMILHEDERFSDYCLLKNYMRTLKPVS